MATFLDKAKIKILSGRGGNGAVAWRREKYVDKGGPAGGDGGRGGDVYFVADASMTTLLDFTFQSIFKAENGENAHRHCVVVCCCAVGSGYCRVFLNNRANENRYH